ncbi:MAG: flagellar basal-body rod protein FlgG [Gammaproteobacteria bacterium]|nr:flagellar basal-body rod protein FlgG [Gammaproteobacteria bacterium]
MNQALWVAKTGLDAQQMRLSVISNNLANVSTTGYKQSRAVFEDLLYQNLRQVGGQTSQETRMASGLSLGAGTRVVATEKIHSQGNIETTSNPLDLAIEGRGFFAIALPDGSEGYTRDGNFMVSDQGVMVTSSGYTLQPSITIPADTQSITIGIDGVVSVNLPGQTSPTTVGNLQLTNFINPTGLQPIGENLFVESASSGGAQPGTPGQSGLGQLRQGALESSNINIVEEMVGMIETQRAYEMNSKLISTADGMMQYLNNNT